MATGNKLDFWFSIGSTYTYLTVSRLDQVAARYGATVNWRPFNVRTIMLEMDNIPFAGKPTKAAYMWRDIERRCVRYGLPARLPAPYPLQELEFANRVAVVAEQEGWIKAYVQHTYQHWFAGGHPAGVEPNLSASLVETGQDPERVITLARGDDAAAALVANTEEAKALGVFGAPTFVVDGEVFWGDDRLEDALDWLEHGRLPAP